MALCSSDCFRATPRWTNACSIQTREGGIPYLVFFSCNFKFGAVVKSGLTGGDVTIGAITDYTAWRTGVQHKLISRTPEGIGEKPATSPTTERVSSCKPESISNMTHTINFTSKDVDTTNLTDVEYWNDICSNYDYYRIGWLGCDDEIVYYTGDASDPGFPFSLTTLSDVFPQTNEESFSYQIGVSFNNRCLAVPLKVTSLNDAFISDVNT